jgi:hypothetical protein
MKTILAAAIAFALMACAASAPRIDAARISALKPGVTTFDEVVRQFGKPSVTSRNPDGTQTAVYLHGADGQSGTTIVPLVAGTPADSTTFYFDSKGVLTDSKIKEAVRAAPSPAPASTLAQPASAPAGATAMTKSAAPPAPATAKTPPAPNVTERWPGSTTENR